ncbi:MAG: oxidoreductase [Planctomycetaceae bacterium]|nr:oxidoreductase [Planctomycetaceae bacterium]
MGKVIVLTGATRGLGRSLLPAFVAGGHTVAGCGRSESHIAELRKAYPAPHSFTPVDVVDPEGIESWAADVLAVFGPPDLLINNAALMNTPAPLWEVDNGEFDAMIDVNIRGVFRIIKAFVPTMVKRGSGVIVNLSSGWGRSTSPGVAPYCATKYAIEGMTLALAQDLPRGMAAVPLNPGIIDTDMLRHAWGQEASSFPSPEQWAKKAAPFLLNLSAKDNGKPLSVL